LPSHTAQNDLEAHIEIEDGEPDTVPISVSLQLLEVEEAALLDESE
jgi:hypothetical protein